MAIAINTTLQNARLWLVNGPAGQFFQWWGKELGDAMPSRLRARMQYARRHLLIQIGDKEIDLAVDGTGTVQSLDSFSTEQDLQLQQQRIRELLQEHELAEVSRDLVLLETNVLRAEITLPLATEANLRQALAYEMDRHTPFQAEEIFFDWRVLSRDRQAGQLHFELFVTQREPVEAWIEQLKRLGLPPGGVDVSIDNQLLGLNLLPVALRHRVVNKQARMNWIFAGVSLLLMVLVMTQSLWLREHQIEAINEAIDEVRAEAMAVQQIRKQIDDASDAAGFLQGRKIQNGYKVEILAELSRILPEDTYLDRLSLHADTTQMQGKSANAQSLIELVNKSEFFDDASFRGPTRLDNRSRKEIFDLSANNVSQDAG